MKNIRLSIKEHYLTDNYNPKFKKYDYIREFDFESLDDIENIYEVVNLYMHSYYEYDENIRSERTFNRATSIVLDFDNKGIHNDSTISEFINSSFGKSYNWYLYTSKSHIPDIQECFHVVIPLDVPITDLSTLRSTYFTIFDALESEGIQCDRNVRDGARLIFPSLNESNYDSTTHFDNFLFELNYDGEYLHKTEPIEISVETVEDGPQQSSLPDEDFDDSDLIGVYDKMSKKSKYTYVRAIMNYINSYNKKSKYRYLTYSRWIALGYSLYKLFGDVNGRKLFRILSDGYPGDSTSSIDKQYEYLTGCVYSSNDNLHILLKMSSTIGFHHDMYMKYYFMMKHRFTITQSAVLYRNMLKRVMDMYGVPLEFINDVKLYDYSFKKNTRSFLMEINDDGSITHMTIRLGEIMDIFSEMLNIPRKFVTSAITRGVVRRFINKNGVYDITRYIKSKILDLVSNSDTEYIRVKSINDVMKDIRSYAPSTIQSLLTNKNIELYMFEVGIFIDKCKKRFDYNGSSKPFMGYKIDKSKIVLSDVLSTPKRAYTDYKVQGSDSINYSYSHHPKINVVMNC